MKSIIASIAIALCGMLFSGCASTGGFSASTHESLLSAAGFVSRTPQTAKQREIYAAAPAYKIQRAEVKGKVYYAWKNEAKGVAWVGDEAAYQRYRELALQQQIAEEQLAAAAMSSTMAWGWYDSYWVDYRPVYPGRPGYPVHPAHPIQPVNPGFGPGMGPRPTPMPMMRPMPMPRGGRR